MKLLPADGERLVFLLSRQQRLLLLFALRRYPVNADATPCVSRSGDAAEMREHQKMLADALAESRRENRRLVEGFLGESGRFEEAGEGYRLFLTRPQVNWLLQVLNEIRVNSWIKLGRPEKLTARLASEHAESVALLELCGIFQGALLAATADRPQ